MRALIITARFTEVPPSTRRLLTHFARKVTSVKGLISAQWMRNGSTCACFQMLGTAHDADRFLDSELLRSLNEVPGCNDIFIQEYDADASLNAFANRRSETQEVAPEPEIVPVI